MLAPPGELVFVQKRTIETTQVVIQIHLIAQYRSDTVNSWRCGSILVYYTRGRGFEYTFFTKIIKSTDSVDSLKII